MKRVRVTVSGRVQGVFFRAACATRARQRGLAGFVRNLPDGRVEAAFEGVEDAVDTMVDWCRRGPEFADVSSVEVVGEPVRGERGFSVTG
ncbi:MAG TPA: acylphosphatase [Actinomycetota bacterium]|nr:acylphosphatase [Actinomycetota bacterium]